MTLVTEFRPAAVISGHVHENRGAVKENGILFMNPGAAKNGFSALLEVGTEVNGTLLDPVSDGY
jgi:Icc-related predicted phosphoesterase